MAKGTLYTISAPSGAGKTSLVKALLDSVEGIGVSVSHTTREKRPGEEHGVDYFFVSHEAFIAMVEDSAFLEHAQVFRNRYGTSQKAVEETLQSGRDVILEIDWQGMQQVKKLRPDCVAVSIVPPSLAALEARLRGRESDSDEEIAHRMAQAKEEVSHFAECDYLVINDDFETALNELKSIVIAHRLQVERQAERHQALLSALT
ncbi:guanylate kinase [gamma proteobacterium HTCC5015]|nr:guanylate kinase [gamma proteobacterium HTCC5015]